MLEGTNSSAISLTPLKGVIAFVGCDGTGKSTLTADLLAKLKLETRVERYYLGVFSGESGAKIKQLPLLGHWLEDYLTERAQRAQDMRLKLPGLGTALLMYILSVRRLLHLWRVIRLSQKGVLVITDRYPQAQIPGFHCDGPGLASDRTGSWLVRNLARQEQRLYDWMAERRPALVVRLTIDADTAHCRKPDHSLAELNYKISILSQLHFNHARVVEIDARAPYAEVLNSALIAISSVVDTSGE
jgi:hypothetical protein